MYWESHELCSDPVWLKKCLVLVMKKRWRILDAEWLNAELGLKYPIESKP